MTRQTSIEVYNRLLASGFFNTIRGKAYQHLWHYGPLTVGELHKAIFSDKSRNDISTRITELKDQKLAYEVGTRICRVSNNETQLVDVTEGMPVALSKDVGPPKPTNTEVNSALDSIKSMVFLTPEYGTTEVLKLGEWLRWKANK